MVTSMTDVNIINLESLSGSVVSITLNPVRLLQYDVEPEYVSPKLLSKRQMETSSVREMPRMTVHLLWPQHNML